MTTFETVTLVVGLYVVYEIFALMIGASIGKRVSVFRRLVFVIGLIALSTLSFMLLTGRA